MSREGGEGGGGENNDNEEETGGPAAAQENPQEDLEFSRAAGINLKDSLRFMRNNEMCENF